MAQTNPSLEHVDFNFRPRLLSLARGDYLSFATSHGFGNVALPAPSLDRDRKLALWHATVPNHLGELGIIAVSARKFGNIMTTQRQWFCGVVPGDIYDEAKPVHAELAPEQLAQEAEHETRPEEDLLDLEFASVLIEFANFGPNTLFERAEIPGAFDLLQALYRK